MQNRTTDKINEISIVPNLPNYSIVVLASLRALHLHFATDTQLAKPCMNPRTACVAISCTRTILCFAGWLSGCKLQSVCKLHTTQYFVVKYSTLDQGLIYSFGRGHATSHSDCTNIEIFSVTKLAT